jgi:dTDP-4-amino-4,6-dideoxygalactose transaminase
MQSSPDTTLALARVLTSGVVMSIEKKDKELPALARALCRTTGRAHAVLVNSRTAAVHAALAGQGVGHGGEISPPPLDAALRAFVDWLGVRTRAGAPATFGYVEVRAGATLPQSTAPALVLDLTPLGFGPAAALLTDDQAIWARAERLKIFGAHDLRTMWTQEEADPDLVPGVQFNYRLSPLVAACIRMTLGATA